MTKKSPLVQMSEFIVNLTDFVTWSPRKKIIISILGDDPFGMLLNIAASEKKVDGVPITLKRVKSVPQNCQILFVCQSEKPRLTAILNKANSNTLTVSNIRGFKGSGGHVEFIESGDKIKLRLNTQAFKKTPFKVHASLCDLST